MIPELKYNYEKREKYIFTYITSNQSTVSKNKKNSQNQSKARL